MTQRLSEKIKVLSFVSIVLVLYIHSGFHDYPHEIQGMPYNRIIQDFVSGMLGRCAVPLFFMISGFLFFQNVNDVRDVFIKQKRRFKSLVIPFVVAAFFLPLFYLCMDFVPWIRYYVNSEGFVDQLNAPWYVVLQSLFYKVPNGTSPWGFHLWFLRDLIIIVFIMPIVFLLRKNIGKVLLISIVFILSRFDFDNIFMSLFWFLLGDLLFLRISNLKSLLYIVLFVVLSVLQLCFCDLFIWKHLQVPIIFVGIVGLMALYEKIIPENFQMKGHVFLQTMCSYVFFIYLYHEPTINIIRKMLVIVLGQSPIGFGLSYLLSPWLFIVIFTMVGIGLNKFVPKIYSVIVGGRI